MAELRYPAERVCLVLLSGLGDVVMGLPLVNALKDDHPRRHITWVVEPMPSAVLRDHASVDEIIPFDRRGGWRAVRELRRVLVGRRFDLALNLNVYFKSVWPTLFSGAPHRLAFERGRARDAVWLAANHHLPRRPHAHTLDMFLEFAEWLGLRPFEPEWRIGLTDSERRAQAEFFAELGDRPVVSVIPATAMASKDWIAERYARLVNALERDLGFRTVLLGGPGERENRVAREIAERSSVDPVWALGDGVRRLIWTIAGSNLVIAPDTGPVHVARALNVPVIGLYGRTNPWRVGPYRAYEELWVDRYTNPGEAPDPTLREPRTERMQQITVRDVLERVERAMARYPRTTGRVG